MEKPFRALSVAVLKLSEGPNLPKFAEIVLILGLDGLDGG